MELHFLKAVLPLFLILHVKDLVLSESLNLLTFISFSATRTLSLILFARKTNENFPWPANHSINDIKSLLTNQLLNFKSVNGFTDEIGNLVRARGLGHSVRSYGHNF